MEAMLSAGPDGNLTTNFDPVRSSVSLRGLNRQMTRMLSSVGSSFSAEAAEADAAPASTILAWPQQASLAQFDCHHTPDRERQRLTLKYPATTPKNPH